MIVLGIDIGGKDVKVLLLGDEKILDKEKKTRRFFEQGKVTEELIEKAIENSNTSRKDIDRNLQQPCGP